MSSGTLHIFTLLNQSILFISIFNSSLTSSIKPFVTTQSILPELTATVAYTSHLQSNPSLPCDIPFSDVFIVPKYTLKFL